MPGSIPETIAGTVELRAELSDLADGSVAALLEMVSTWISTVETGFFGGGEVRLLQPIQSQGRSISGQVICEHVPARAFWMFGRMVSRFSGAKEKIAGVRAWWVEGRRNVLTDEPADLPRLPAEAPFRVEIPNDVSADVRVEFDFVKRLTAADRSAVFHLFSLWNVLVEAQADEAVWDEESEYETRLMSPSAVEHVVYGYFAGFEGFDLAVRMGHKLHLRLPLAGMSFE